MRFRIDQRFDGPLDDVERALLDPTFLERLGALPKLGAPALVEQRDEGALVHRRIRFHFVGELNAAVRRVVDPDRLTWIEESTVDRSTHVTEWRIVPDHYAALIRCSGTFRLEPDGPALTRRITEADIDVKVPLVGGRVERAIVSGLEDHARGEEEVMRTWLGGDDATAGP